MSDNKKHAVLAPSSAERWMICPGSVLLERNLPDVENEYSKEGTAAHEYASLWLSTRIPPILPWTASNGVHFPNDEQKIGESMDAIRYYVKTIQELSEGHQLLIEQPLPIGHITLEEGAEGTGDAIILNSDGETLEISDLKFGRGIKVYAKKNKQMMLYALGALKRFETLGDFKKFILRIHQPRLDHLDEWECTIEELNEFADEVTFKADFIWRMLKGETPFRQNEDLVPTEEGCCFCKARATCPALSKHVAETIAGEFVDMTKNPVAKLNTAIAKLEHVDNERLGWFMQNLDLIESWCMAVRAKTEAELFAGHEVPGQKLVAGKKGNRKWISEEDAEKEMKALRLKSDEMYESKLISPSTAEKMLKKQPRRWNKLLTLIVQNPGKPSVAPSTDPRPALVLENVANDFKVLEQEKEDA